MAKQTISANESAPRTVQRINENFTELYNNSGGGGGSSSSTPLKLNILVLANSHGFDCWSYVPFILKEYGINIKLGLWFRPGQNINGHYSNYYDGEAYASGENNPRLMVIDTENGDTAWSIAVDDDGQIASVSGGTNASAHRAVCYADWDIVVFMGAHSNAERSDTFCKIDELCKLVASDLGRPFMLGLMTSVVYTQWKQIAMLGNVKNSCNVYPIDIVFPGSVGIYNAQQDATLDDINNSLFAGDSVHLNEGMPCYIAALGNVEKIFRTFYPHLSVLNDQTRPTSTWLSGKSIPGQQGNVDNTAVTDDNCYLAQQMAILANDYPFDIANREVSIVRTMSTGVKITGTLTDDTITQSVVNNGTFYKMRHSNLVLHFHIESPATSLDSVSYTYLGVTHTCTITDSTAMIVIDDLIGDVSITATATTN